jgi:hypothetical protein
MGDFNIGQHLVARTMRPVRSAPLIEAHFDQLLTRHFADDGPMFLAAKIDDKPGPVQTPRDPALIRNRFMKGFRRRHGRRAGLKLIGIRRVADICGVMSQLPSWNDFCWAASAGSAPGLKSLSSPWSPASCRLNDWRFRS